MASAAQPLGDIWDGVTAIIICTLPNVRDAHCHKWSGSNPPYLTPAAVAWLRAHGAQHIVLDLPSADKEDDGGHLVAHRTFWQISKRGAMLLPAGEPVGSTTAGVQASANGCGGVPLASEHDADDADPAQQHVCERTITEMAFVPDSVSDGRYMLVLAVAPIQLDAAPSDPLLVPLTA